MRVATLILALLVSLPAAAVPLRAKNGSTMNLKVAGKHERGIGLRTDGKAWRLEIGALEGTAEVFDVTPNVIASKWVVPVVNGALVFDATRFIGGHAYRVDLRHGGSAFVYLYPPKLGSKNSRVVFADSDAAAPHGEVGDGIAITPKSAL